ncbi:hypothetical protein KPL70_023155 [Citrus sinensis]|nr:hypothetical protein KPL70_023155 [Citrus sinensis]
MAEGTRAHDQRRLEESVQQLQEASNQQAMELKEFSQMMAAISLKLDQMMGTSGASGTRSEGGSSIPIKPRTGSNPVHMQKDLKQVPQVAAAHIFSLLLEPCINSTTSEIIIDEPAELQHLLKKYHGVFMEPKGLSPPRAQDHRIPLLPDSVPPNIRPYRYPYVQKAEIERMIKELLAAGSIQRSTLLKNHLFVKKSKCSFGKEQVEYLGHLISKQGVATDPAKIESMKCWPSSNSLKALRGFLGLTGYYRRFIKDYGKITMPDFQKTFVLECDASGEGIGAVLSQEGRPISYLSKALSPKNLGLSAYEKEMLAVVFAVQKWRPYLLGKHFKVITDHFSLKYMLEQPLKQLIMSEAHGGTEGGHSGVRKTLDRVKRSFYWKRMQREICSFVAACDNCQRNKHENVLSPGLLQPLPIPEHNWTDISMDFIEGLPKSSGKQIIFVVVDRLSKYAHFMPLSHPYTALDVAQLFLDNVYKLHGLPNSITEVVNKCLEQYLRCMVGDRPKEWVKWLPLAEWWYNTSSHLSTRMTPFEAVYGRPPPSYIAYIPGTSTVATVDLSLKDRDAMIRLLKANLVDAQARMKLYADKKKSERKFEVGDMVFLRLQPYKQVSLSIHSNRKLSPRFYGPYKVIQKIGQVAYKLELPIEFKIHPVFHVSCLKKKVGEAVTPITELPTIREDGHLQLVPDSVLDRRVVQRSNRPCVQWLVQWSNSFPEDATWEDAVKIQEKFPLFKP